MLRGILLRFNHHSFDLGMGPQQIKQLLEVLNRDVEELAQAIFCCIKSPEANSSGISEDYDMTLMNEEDQSQQSPSLVERCADSLTQRHEISSQIVQMVFNSIMICPLAAVSHKLSVLESPSQVGLASAYSRTRLCMKNTCYKLPVPYHYGIAE